MTKAYQMHQEDHLKCETAALIIFQSTTPSFTIDTLHLA